MAESRWQGILWRSMCQAGLSTRRPPQQFRNDESLGGKLTAFRGTPRDTIFGNWCHRRLMSVPPLPGMGWRALAASLGITINSVFHIQPQVCFQMLFNRTATTVSKQQHQ
jgi:hypothetical protein